MSESIYKQFFRQDLVDEDLIYHGVLPRCTDDTKTLALVERKCLGVVCANRCHDFSKPLFLCCLEGDGAGELTASFYDTVYYGGTTWAPDSMRWEALRDSVWTFDTKAG